MIDVTFTINGVDYAPKLSTYNVVCEFEASNIVTAIDGTEHYGKIRKRPSIYFSLMPLSDEETATLYNAVSDTNTVVYTDPDMGADYTANMRFVGSIASNFGLRSIDGNRYYKGGEMVLRQISVR